MEKNARKTRQPRQDRARETVDCIVNGARKGLVEFGYTKLTTNKIAKLAGVSIGSLYQYFSNKDEIVRQMLEGFMDEMSNTLIATAQENLSKGMEATIEVCLSQIVDLFYENKDLIRVARQEIPLSQSAPLYKVHDKIISAMSMFGFLIAGNQAKNAEVKAFIGFYALDGALMGWLCSERKFDKEVVKEELIEMAREYFKY